MSFYLIRNLILGSLFIFCYSVWAHTPYVAPTTFETITSKRGLISFDASLTERFFVPDVALKDIDFTITHPDGKQTAPHEIVSTKTRTVIDHKLEQAGTYRLSSGVRERVFLVYDLNGERKFVRDPKPDFVLPKNAVITRHAKQFSRVDTYVSYKKTSNKVLQTETEGLQVKPLNNPTALIAGKPFKLKLSLNGKPLAKNTLQVLPSARNQKASTDKLELTSNKKGIVTLNLASGRYLLKVQHKTAAPVGEAVPTYNYSHTLSIEVFAKYKKTTCK